MTIITSIINALQEHWHYGRWLWALLWKSLAAIATSLLHRVTHTLPAHTHTHRLSVKLNCVSGLGAMKGFSHFTHQPSTCCDWHKWVGTKESLWLSHTLLVTLTLCPASCLFIPSHCPPAVAIHQANLNSTRKHTQHLLGGFRTWSDQNTLFLPAAWSLPICHTEWLTDHTVGGHNVFRHPPTVHQRHTTAHTHNNELMCATENMVRLIFENIFHMRQFFLLLLKSPRCLLLFSLLPARLISPAT